MSEVKPVRWVREFDGGSPVEGRVNVSSNEFGRGPSVEIVERALKETDALMSEYADRVEDADRTLRVLRDEHERIKMLYNSLQQAYERMSIRGDEDHAWR